MKQVYVWEFPVRLTHWLLAASIFVLSLTGFYIGAPFIYGTDWQAVGFVQGPNGYEVLGNDAVLIMAWVRFVHFVAAFIFSTAFLVRLYWWFAGNQYARYDQFIPTNMERVKNCVDTGLFYAFCKKTLPHSPGHTGLAGLSYTFLFLLYITEIITGSAMLYLAHGGGTIFWLLGGWSLAIMSVGYLRLIHHLAMWVIAVIVVAHIYIGWHNDLVERNGLISSIFSGYKSQEDGH
jgi:Ni/Fe-hydrogenase 1 B-type cytochrome subunit